MKKINILSLILVAVLCSFAQAQSYLRSFAMGDPSYVYTKEANGNLKWLATLDAGTKYDGVFNEDYIPETINNNSNEKNKLVFTAVEYEGKKVYTMKNTVLAETRNGLSLGSRAVLTKDSLLYTWGQKGCFENVILPVGTVVVISEETGYSYDEDLIRVYFFDNQVFWKVRAGYVLKNNVSEMNGDYDAVVLVKSALTKDASKDAEIIAKLLSSAEDRADSTGIHKYVEQAAEKIEASDISNSGIEEFVKQAEVSSDGSKVNVRDVPGTKGKVVGQLLDGGYVDIYQRTEKKDTIGGETDYWYHISTPGENSVDGWVFGSALKFR